MKKTRAEGAGAQPSPTDEALMCAYAAGDTQAFEELFRRYENVAYGFFLRRTRSHERAQDLYQELFLRIHRARGRYDPARRFTPWFFQIANRLLVDDYRRAFRTQEVPLGEREVRAQSPDGGERVAEREQLSHLLEALSREERELLVARAGGTGYAELAERLGKSVDAVKKVASRAVLRLRESGLIDITSQGESGEAPGARREAV